MSTPTGNSGMSECAVLGVERREGVEGDHIVLDWLVDDEPFGELVRVHNGWAQRGPFMSFLEHGSGQDYLLGRLADLEALSAARRASVLVCPECHDPVCLQISVGVRQAGDRVVWDDIAQDNGHFSRTDDVFAPGWQNEFCREQYDDVLGKVRDYIRTHHQGPWRRLDLSNWS